ncbi:MAG: hypothetical protein K6C12_13980 [Oscillospiraceae bacterium]|nr:hypothetical protein [Oscillospiraceae bacterium]
MKKMIIALLISLQCIALFSSGAFAEAFDPTEEESKDVPVGWGVFSLPADLKPQSFAPSGETGPTENPPVPSAGLIPQPVMVRNDEPSSDEKTPEETEEEIMERSSENGPLPLLSIVPIPYIPIQKIDTNFYR